MPVRPRVVTGKRRPRNAAPESAADLLPAVVARIGGDDRGVEQQITLVWREAVGEMLALRTRPEAVRGKTLLVRVSSSAFAHELTLLKGEIIEKLRVALGPGRIQDLRTRVGRLDD